MLDIGSLSVERLYELAREARNHFAPMLLERLSRYQVRQRQRRLARQPVLAFCGWGRAGKDESAMIVERLTRLRYGQSTSTAVLPLVAWALEQSNQDAWNTRHQHRQAWYHFCNGLRRDDPSFLVRLNLSEGDMVVGVRDSEELQAAHDLGIIDRRIWIDRPGTPRDKTVTYTADDCDAVLSNSGTLGDLERTLIGWLEEHYSHLLTKECV